jgi:hypothetical protein
MNQFMASKKNTKKEWSMFTYMAGDNNLSPEGLADVTEMEKSGSSDKSNVVVEMDANTSDFEGSYRWEITKKDPRTNTGPRKVMQRLSEVDSGDPVTLTNFLKWAKDLYPADKYIVVCWNHGSGFRLRGNRRYPLSPRAGSQRAGSRKSLFQSSNMIQQFSAAARNILSDDMTRNSVDMVELAKALKNAGFSGPNKIDILGFDAGLMNMLEVDYQMLDFAKFVVGSEELEPGKGWPYTMDLDHLNGSKLTSGELVKKFVQNYGAFYNQESERNQWPITQSAIDLSLIGDLASSVNEFGNALKTTLPNSMPILSRIREQVQYYAADVDYDDYVDLIDFADLCKSNMADEKVKKYASEVISNARKAVKAEVHYGKDVANSHGLTIWLPEGESKYRNNRKAYELLQMTKDYGGWNKFLSTYHPPPGASEVEKLLRSENK